jgi:hypothetical protein
MFVRKVVETCALQNIYPRYNETKQKRRSAMCPLSSMQSMGLMDGIMCYGIKVFLLIWIVFVPIAITARLEKIIKLLQEKK